MAYPDTVTCTYCHGNTYPVADSHGSTDLHAVPDIHTMAYLDTVTCTDPASGTVAGCYGSTDSYANRRADGC